MRARGLSLSLIAAVAATACSGGHHSSSSKAATSTSTTDGTIAIADGTAVNQTVFYTGFTVALVSMGASGHDLTIAAQVTNNLSGPSQFDPFFAVTSGGNTYAGRSATDPTISAGATVPVDLTATTDANFTAADAQVVFGNQGKNQAIAPLGSPSGLVPQANVNLPPPAPVTAGEQVFTFTKAIVSPYMFDGSQLDAGTDEIQLTMSVKNNDPVNSYNVDGSDFRFVNGPETLNGGDDQDTVVNPGGLLTMVEAYADVDGYKAGTPITMTIVGADAQQNSVSQTTTITLPPLA